MTRRPSPGSVTSGPVDRPPSVDRVVRSLDHVDLPRPLLVDLVRTAIDTGALAGIDVAAADLRRGLFTPVINATGVLLHTNLGRAPQRPATGVSGPPRAMNVELDLTTGERGSRQRAAGSLFATLTRAEAAMVVNNNAAAVLLTVAAIATGRGVAVSRGESVEIGGGFRVPEVIVQSGARLVDVGTTNRTRVDDYARAIDSTSADVAMVLKVHPSNYRIDGFVETADVSELSTLAVPVVVDIGSGLLDARCPWLAGAPPAWLAGEPAARQTIAAGASLVTFSTDKLLGGPQGGVIVGRADLVERCARHPLARALRPGGLVLGALQELALAYLSRDVSSLPFWTMATASVDSVRARATAIVAAAGPALGATVIDTEVTPGAGSTPGVTIPSCGVQLDGGHTAVLRRHAVPILARVRDRHTIVDVRSFDPADDGIVVDAIRALH